MRLRKPERRQGVGKANIAVSGIFNHPVENTRRLAEAVADQTR